ncbi:MAG: hypothetical protein IE928_05950 [Gammaproteobacteria bacterium]|nr:hypothetical protein [Gammaproteobacteria bacterium]
MMRLILLILTALSMPPLWAATAEEVAVERVLLDQTMHLAKNDYQVKAWVASRQVFQQQALVIHVQLTTANASSSLPSLSVASQADNAWLQPIVSHQPRLSELDGKTVAQWQLLVFAKQVGVNALPNLRLQWVGESMSRQTQTLPSWSIKVSPLPVYVPEQAIVGELVNVQTRVNLPSILLVDEVIQRQVQFRLVNHLPNSLWLNGLLGQGIEPLSPWLQSGDSAWQEEGWLSDWIIWQPWRISQAGFWQVDAQDIWVFNPRTWQVTHLQLPAHSGWAIPLWLWHSVQVFLLLVFLLFSYLFIQWSRCWLNRRHYRQAIERCADSAQLYHLMVQMWQLTPDIPLAHQALPLPIYQSLVELENQLFSGEVLYNEKFVQIKQYLKNTKVWGKGCTHLQVTS